MKEVFIDFLNKYSRNLDKLCTKEYYELNKHLYFLVLKGLGISNCDHRSGENVFLNWFLPQIDSPIVFDIGANIGNYSILAKNINKKAIIYSFEPHPISYQQLKFNSDIHGFKAINLGLSGDHEEMLIYDYENNEGSEHASLYKEVIENIHRGKSKAYNVKLVSLDHFMSSEKINHIHLLKIDTEGHELNVLKGALSAIRNNLIDLIHIEFNEMNVYSKVFFKDIMNLLDNYIFFRMLSDGIVPIIPYNPMLCEIFYYQNIVAINKRIVH